MYVHSNPHEMYARATQVEKHDNHSLFSTICFPIDKKYMSADYERF